jgi:GNAT superfamily N-acetyltransferase
MSYIWKISGIIPEPLLVRKDYWTTRHAASDVPVQGLKGRIIPEGHPVEFFHNLKICRARMQSEDGKGLILLDALDNHVGMCCTNWAHLDPEYQGKGLAAELIAEQILYNYDVVMRKTHNPFASINPMATKSFLRARMLLLERGAIYEE